MVHVQNSNFTLNNGVFTKDVISGEYNPPHKITGDILEISTFKVPTERQKYMKYVIGKKGYCFIAITKMSNATYIWYHSGRGVVEIWGTSNAIRQAQRLIRCRIQMIEDWMNQNDQGASAPDYQQLLAILPDEL